MLFASPLPAADAPRLIRGPWWWRAPDGTPSIAVAVSGNVPIPARCTVDGRDIAVSGTLSPCPSATDSVTAILVLHLPSIAGELRVDIAGQPVVARLRPAIPADGAVRLALAGGRAWPDRAAIDGLGRVLGGAPQVVLALGPGVPARLGTGGWEADIPIVVVAPEDPALAASTGGTDAAWRHGVRLGLLGLPASMQRASADLALARDLSPWLVYLDVPAGWDPAISQHQPGAARDLGVLLAACQRLKVPLVLGAGASGLVSEPLGMGASGSVEVAADGVRYVLPVPAADDGLSHLPTEVSLPLEQPVIAGLAASADALRLELLRPGQSDAVRLAWRRAAEPTAASAAELQRQVASAESLADPAVRAAIVRWTWLPRQALAGALPPVELIARLRDEGGAQGRALARRLSLIAGEDPSIPPLPGEADPLALRDRLLAKLATVRGAEAASWLGEAAASADPLVLRALLADLARDHERSVLPALVERVTRQAAGTLPLDPDPIDQHRLFAAVFDDIHLSPTPLRPLAVALRDKANVLARGPLDRFIARHGEMRPVP